MNEDAHLEAEYEARYDAPEYWPEGDLGDRDVYNAERQAEYDERDFDDFEYDED